MPGGRPRKTTEGVDEKTLKARTKATDYAEKKRMELYALQLEILDCEQDLKKMKESKKEIKTDIKKYENKTMTPFVMDDLDLPIPKKIYKPKYSKNIDNLLADYKTKNPNPTKVKKGPTERVAKLLAEKSKSRKPKPAMSVMA